MKVIVLSSGPSRAFKEAGYSYPKNLVEIAGKPLVQRVMDALRPLKAAGAQFICVIPREENRQFHTGKVIKLVDPAATLVEAPGETSGAACSALLAADHLDASEPLVVVNGDQIIAGADPAAIVRGFRAAGWDAGAVVFEDVHPRWSFVKCDAQGRVVEAAEKRPISKFATAGFYYFARAGDFVAAAMRSIVKDAHVNGAFYICPVLNELILQQARVGIHAIGRTCYHSLASPADVQAYAATARGDAPEGALP
jgi:dTDP-glucose pyrophosphorylase